MSPSDLRFLYEAHSDRIAAGVFALHQIPERSERLLFRRKDARKESAYAVRMSDRIHFDLTVDEVMRRWPVTVRTFLDFGFGCVGCPIAGFHTVADACAEHRVVPDDFRHALEVVTTRPLPPVGA